MKYTEEELDMLNAIEGAEVENESYDNQKIKEMATYTLDYLKEKKQISINMKRSDLDFLKQRANDTGISYQNIIQALVHNYTTGKLKLNI